MPTPEGTVEVPLGLFGGVNYDLSPTDLPAGLSPDARNMAFLPSSAFTRPSLQRYLTLGNTAQVVYAESYVKANGATVQFVCDSTGSMYADGVKIGQTAAGSRFKTTQLFNKLFIAISDGDHGADVPLQYDGKNLDRISQDGPGAAPTASDQALAATALIAGSTGASFAVTSATPINPQTVQVGDGGDGFAPQYETYYTQVSFVTGTAHGLVAGQTMMVSGNSLYNYGSAIVSSVPSTTNFTVSDYNTGNSTGTGGSVQSVASLLSRSNNTVTAATAAPHGLQVGYKQTIAGVPDAATPVTNIVINNITAAGTATITTPAAHGFVPGNVVSLLSVAAVTVGGSVSNYSVTNGLCTVTTASAHGLSAGTAITLALNTFSPRNELVANVLSATQFTVQTGDPNVSGTGGSVTVPWIAASGQTFAVVTGPTPTTFTIAITGPTFTWTTGSITFPWNGTFYVTSVQSATTFTYAQNGPDNVIASGSGTVTPAGQIAPGTRNAVCLFLTRSGYTTAPSPTVQFTSSGGEYVLMSNIPIGPANVVARIIAFSGANGGRYFYLPVAPQANGTIVGTSTVVNDNTTTTAVFDFSDQSLLSATAIDIPGNNLFNQAVLGPCLGLYPYANRMFAFGEYNKLNQFANMGFEGGSLAATPTVPLGWAQGSTPGAMVAGDYGMGYRFAAAGSAGAITQPAFRDRYGVAILQPGTQYSFRAWVNGSVTAELYSPVQGTIASATIAAAGAFGYADFSGPTGTVIPPDAQLRISGGTVGSVVDEIEVVYTLNPFLKAARASYINNPEAFDAVANIIGPSDDQNEIRAMFERKGVLHFLTHGPDGALYETSNTPSECSGWSINHVASRCGAISVWGDTRFEDWQVWASDTGLRMYNGGDVEKMSQEIEPVWLSITATAKQYVFVANDPYVRRIYLGLPTNGAATVNTMYPLDYRELNTAVALSSSPPLRTGMGGKVFTTDLTRKWCPWDMTINYAALLKTVSGASFMAFCCGQGAALSKPSFGAIYKLNEGAISGVDDDYGPFTSRYTTYFFVSQDEASQYRLGVHRKIYPFMTSFVSGMGYVRWTPLVDSLTNAYPQTALAPLQTAPTRDLEFGLSAQGDRCAFRIDSSPDANGFSGFSLNNVVVSVMDNPHTPIAGYNGG